MRWTILLLAGLIALAPIVSAEAVIGIDAVVYDVPVFYEVFNATISIPANGSLVISVQLPQNWTLNDTAAIHVVAANISSAIKLSARDANGSELASATIIPLSTEYHVTLPPNTRNISLANSGSQVAEGRLVVLVESKPVRFRLEMPSEARLEPGTATYVHGRIIQEEGPSGFIWAQWVNPTPLNVSVYWGYLEDGTPPTKGVPASTERFTRGAGWSENFTILLDAGRVDREDRFSVTVSFFYASDLDSIDVRPQLVASISLSGQVDEASIIGGVPVSEDKARIAAAAFFIVVLGIVGAILVSRR